MNTEFLKEMIKTMSVSGHEEQLQKKVIEYMKPYVDDTYLDATGNVISVLNPQSETKILLCGHIDEIGMVVTHIEQDGSLRVCNVGGVRAKQYLGTFVQIKTANGIINGTIITNQPLLNNHDLQVKDLIVDIGAKSKEEASKVVSVGDPLCALSDVNELLNHRLAGRAFDDRIGAFIVIETLRKCKEKNCSIGVYSATTVGEETSMRGAYWASQKVKPTCAIAVDVTYTSDYAGVSPATTGEVGLDLGPVLCHSSIVNKKMNQLLKESAERLNYSLQYEIATGRTGTDADNIHFTNDGVPVALVSIPLRYMHSSIETLSLKDVEQIIDLLVDFIIHYPENTNLNPIQ